MRGEQHEKENRKNDLIDRGDPIPEDDTEGDVSTSEADAEGTDVGNKSESPEESPEFFCGRSADWLSPTLADSAPLRACVSPLWNYAHLYAQRIM
ncbi:MAG: hypothetical protein HFG52_15840 [Lachnospiraceae bacterium]|jgi:hypothetical protein|nr:hypothetical protein [Lachnospiraceae bacterium]